MRGPGLGALLASLLHMDPHPAAIDILPSFLDDERFWTIGDKGDILDIDGIKVKSLAYSGQRDSDREYFISYLFHVKDKSFLPLNSGI